MIGAAAKAAKAATKPTAKDQKSKPMSKGAQRYMDYREKAKKGEGSVIC